MLDTRQKWAPLMDAEGGAGGSEGSGGTEGSEGTEGAEGAGEGGKEGEQQPNPRAIPKYSDDDLDKILEKKIAKIEAKVQAKADESAKLAQMNATEKVEYELKTVREELESYKRKEATSNMIAQARAMLTEKGLSVVDEIVATLVVPDDAEATKTAVEAFAIAYNRSIEEALKEKMKGTPPRTGTPGKSLTREEIMAIPDGDARRKAIQENIALFEKK